MALFSDPVAQAIIIDPDTRDEWKWTAAEFPVTGFPYLVGCSINYEMGPKVAMFTLSFDIPYEQGVALMQLPSPFKVGNLVKARIGYAAGAWTPWVEGFLKSGGDGLSIDANGVSGQIMVQGLAESYGYTVDKDLMRESGWDPIKILGACARGMGLKSVISGGASAELTAYKLIGERRGQAVRQKTFDFSSSLLNLSYWEVVKKICDEWNLTCWMGPEVGVTDPGRNLFVYTKAELSKGVDQDVNSRTYMIRGVIDEANLTYPCFAWGAEGSGGVSWLASTADPAAHGVTTAWTDKSTGEIKEDAMAPAEQPEAISGVVTDDAPIDKEVDGVKDDESRPEGIYGTYFSIAASSESEERVKKLLEHRQNQGNAAQRGTITTLGIPDERPGNLCNLRGAGLIYDGPYQIRKLTHSYAPGSWEMTLVVQRSGRILKTGEQAETAEGQMGN
jgi:hypothetical protein